LGPEYIWLAPRFAKEVLEVYESREAKESVPMKISDVSGNTLNAGSAQTWVQLECGPVFNGSGDVVTITPVLYAYYSISCFQHYSG